MMIRRRFLMIIPALLMAGIIQAQDLQTALEGQIDIVVARDSSGDFTSITDAVYSVPRNRATRTVIFVKKGTYREKLEVEEGINKVTLIGEDVDSTFIVFDDYSGSGELYNGIMDSRVGDPIGTSTSHTMYIDSDEFIVMNLTIVNSAGRVGQAVALNLGGDRTIVVHCRILGNQDTFYTWGYGRFLMYDCFIEGNVDFIFGRGVALFDSCMINTNRSSCQITAASTDADWKFGYVFQNCRITANRGVSGVTLGRPWKDYAQTVFMNCDLGKHISSPGWTDWDGRSVSCYYAEYHNFGPGSDTSSRVSWSYQLSDTEAQKYTRNNLFARTVNPSYFGSDWKPDIHNDAVYQILAASTDLLYLDTLQNNADLKSLAVSELPVEDFDPAVKTYTLELSDTVTQVPEISAESLSPKATVEIIYPDTLPGNASVVVTAINGFTSTYTVKYKLAAGTGSPEKKPGSEVTLMSNPFRNELRLKLNEKSTSGPVQLSLISMNGTLVASRTYQDYLVGESLILETASLNPGIYICRVTTGKLVTHVKVIRE
jgi:pectinesterase